MLRPRFLRTGLLAWFLIVTSPCLGADGPAETVETFHRALLGVMKEAEALGLKGRCERLSPVVREAFDFPFIGKLALGRHWEALSEQDRKAFLDLFARISIATYAGSFDGYHGERFETRGTEAQPKGRVLVKTVLVAGGEESVSLDYLLQETGGAWRIVNVIAEGVSDLSIKRAEYSGIAEEKGLPLLLLRMGEKVPQACR